MLGWLLLLLLQTLVLAETWLRAQANGARHHCQQVFESLLDAVPFPFNLLIDCLIPRRKQTRGRVPGPPKTIALVLAETSFSKSSIRQLADVISWCAQTGLTHISVYDPSGHVKAQQHALACSVSKDGKSAAPKTFTIKAGYPMLKRDIKPVLEEQSMGPVMHGIAIRDSESSRSSVPDVCSVSSLNTLVDASATRAQPANELSSAVGSQPAGTVIEVTLLSAEDAHAPLVAAAGHGTSSRQVAAQHHGRQSKPVQPNDSQSSRAVNGLGSAGVSTRDAAVSREVQSRAPCDAWAGYTPPARLAAAVAVAKAESSGDLMGFLSMLAVGQTAGTSVPTARAQDGSSLPLNGAHSRNESPLNGLEGAGNNTSTSRATIGDGSSPLSRNTLSEDALDRLGAPGRVLRSTSLDVLDGGAEQAAWLSANGAAENDSSRGDGEDWVAKKGSLRWIRQRGAAAQADGGGPIRRRARRGSRARGDMGYALLRSPWSWGAPADVSTDGGPDEDILSRTHSNGGLSHDSDLALGRSGSDQWLAEHDKGQAEREKWAAAEGNSPEKASKGKWFLSGGQSTEDLLSAFTKDLEAADEPQPQPKAAVRGGADGEKQLLTPADLDAQIASLAGPAAVREPDLILVFGRTFTLAGYPPWPIRFSEMYHMGELATFTRAQFCDALQRYCKTSQRFGT